jgi:3-hydroxybutyryl-CoA dehydrogenase
MHFFNPAPLMQLVEVIKALQTKDEVCQLVVGLVQSLGKTRRVFKDSYGFVVNRALIPMINEAINCVHEGLVWPEDIDTMMKLGANHPRATRACGSDRSRYRARYDANAV